MSYLSVSVEFTLGRHDFVEPGTRQGVGDGPGNEPVLLWFSETGVVLGNQVPVFQIPPGTLQWLSVPQASWRGGRAWVDG